MPVTDRYGLPLTTSSPAAAEHYQRGMDLLLSYGRGTGEAFEAALAADEGLAVAQAGRALFALFLGDADTARTAMALARERVEGASRRERQHVAAVSALVGGDTARGLGLIDEHVAEFPRDALLVNQASSSIGLGGRADREAYRTAFLERLAPAFGEDWWFLSALGFVYHETGRFAESRRLSERSLALYPANANASHNIAHICFETLDNEGGAAFLSNWLDRYDRLAPYHCHLAWHLALFELHRDRPRRALEIYERDILGGVNARLAVMDGSSLLWRFLLYECAEGPLRWEPLTEIATRVARPGFVFGEIHAALAYAACGDQQGLDRLMDGMRALDAKGHPIAGRVALPLVRAAAAFAAGDHAETLAQLEPIEGEIHRMGGSHAQWELFEETMVVSYLRQGRNADAARLLRRRLAGRASALDARWLAQAETATGAV
jgi:tetratricopeptide (TPR) repeat protein